MDAIRVQQVIDKDGEILVKELPYKKGEVIEIILRNSRLKTKPTSYLTVHQLRQSGLIGIWKDRVDIQDSSNYVRDLRQKSQKRRKINYDIVR